MVLGTILDRTQETWGDFVKEQQYKHTSLSKKATIAFFGPITTNITSQLRGTQAGPQPGHSKKITINWTLAIRHACRTGPCEPRSHHPCHQQINAIICCHRRSLPLFEDLLTMLEIV